MVKITFLPQNKEVTAEDNTKILVAATKNKIPIRFGCAACRCGTCAVSVKIQGELSPMLENERALLTKMHLPLDGHIRLSCQTRVVKGEAEIDLGFQDTYDPESGMID